MKKSVQYCVLAAAMIATVSIAVSQQRGPARGGAAAANSMDWPTFGGDNARSNANMAAMKITPANVGSMVRQQVTISAPIDAGLIYLRGVQVNGASHDTFFGTTNLGRTVAIDAKEGKVLWEFAPPGFDEGVAMNPPRGAPDANPMAGVKQITNSTPVADDNRQFIYAASSDGKVTKIAIADGKAVWSTAVTKLPKIEKMDSPLSFVNGRVIVPTAGYVGDMGPYQGHVLVLNAATGAIEHVWNSLCSDRLELMDPTTCQARQSAIWGRAGIVHDPATGNLLFATGNGNYDGKTSWGDALIMLDPLATKMLGNWTTSNNAELNRRDLDMGSTSPVLLGDGYIAQGGKDGTVRLVTMDIIKGTDAHQGGELQVVQVPNNAQLLSASATAKIDGKTYLFVSQGGRGGGGTNAWTLTDHKLVEAWKSMSGGNTPFYANGMLFIYNAQGGGLLVLDARTGASVATLQSGSGHWNSAIVVDDRIAL
ncbi:MAG TPA: PQQ-binding-like beta-propeller repeat protein, partial [Terriglobia bacterium]|nr:PQQ-binding-like beta-propeller repeat protein [Terriglobia bacterium]